MKDLILSLKMAAKDTVDVCMFLIAVILSVLDFFGYDLMGGLGFLTAYIFVLLMRFGYTKKVIFDNGIKLNK